MPTVLHECSLTGRGTNTQVLAKFRSGGNAQVEILSLQWRKILYSICEDSLSRGILMGVES